MFYLLKHIKAILLFRQVADAYRSEVGKDKPALLTRRFIHSIIASSGAAAAMYGMDLQAGLLEGIEQHISNVLDVGYQIYLLIKSIIPSLIFIYGAIGIIIGYFKRQKPTP